MSLNKMILSLAAMGLLAMSCQVTQPGLGASFTDDRGPGGNDGGAGK